MGLLLARIVVGVLALLGVTTIIRMIAAAMSTSKKSDGAYVIKLEGQDADLQLMCAIERVRCGFFESRSPIIAIDDGIEYETKKRCEIAADGSYVIFCDSSELMSIL